jgi:hypothetical protein
MDDGFGFDHFTNSFQSCKRPNVSIDETCATCSRLTIRSQDSNVLFSALEAIVDPQSWAKVDSSIVTREKQCFLELIASRGWVAQLVTAFEKLVAASVSVTRDPAKSAKLLATQEETP